MTENVSDFTKYLISQFYCNISMLISSAFSYWYNLSQYPVSVVGYVRSVRQLWCPAFLCSSLSFEKAYCEYRLNRTEDALATIQSVAKPDSRLQELLGQVVCMALIKALLATVELFCHYLCQGGYVVVIVCLSVCLLATFHKNFRTDLHEIFR